MRDNPPPYYPDPQSSQQPAEWPESQQWSSPQPYQPMPLSKPPAGYYGYPPPPPPTGPTAHERSTAAAAHGAIAFGLLGIGFLITIAINIYFWFASQKSPYIRRQVEQAGCYQLIVMLVDFLLVAGGGVLLGYLLGQPILGRQLLPAGSEGLFWLLLVFLVVFFIVFFFVTIAYGLYAAGRAAAGVEFRYNLPGLRRMK